MENKGSYFVIKYSLLMITLNRKLHRYPQKFMEH